MEHGSYSSVIQGFFGSGEGNRWAGSWPFRGAGPWWGRRFSFVLESHSRAHFPPRLRSFSLRSQPCWACWPPPSLGPRRASRPSSSTWRLRAPEPGRRCFTLAPAALRRTSPHGASKPSSSSPASSGTDGRASSPSSSAHVPKVRAAGPASTTAPASPWTRSGCGRATDSSLSSGSLRRRATRTPAPPASRLGCAPRGSARPGSSSRGELAIVTAPPALAPLAERFRDRYGRTAALAVPDPAAQALVRALAVGDRTDLSSEVNDDFSSSGLAHILSVSGLHIAVVAAGLYRALRWLLSRSERLLLSADVRAVAALSALPATWLYVWVAGAEVPAVRSGIMASALFLAIALRRDVDAPSSLAAALLAVLAYDPSSLWAVSFQLSFAAVAGLMVLSEPLRALIPIPQPDLTDESPAGKLRRWAESALGAAVASFAASVSTAPLVAATFHRASLVAVLSNAVALPIASGLTGVAALSAAALPWGEPVAAALICAAGPLASALLFLSHLFGTMPFASTLVPAPSLPFMLAWYCGLAGLAVATFDKRLARRLLLASLLVILPLTGWRILAPRLQKDLVVTFLSVGQGDSTLIQAPGGEALLLDAGGDPAGHFDPGARIVVPALVEARGDAPACRGPLPSPPRPPLGPGHRPAAGAGRRAVDWKGRPAGGAPDGAPARGRQGSGHPSARAGRRRAGRARAVPGGGPASSASGRSSGGE
ncbi:MAG: ComEC/Rec2 family competence protein [Myxococcales bacterium]